MNQAISAWLYQTIDESQAINTTTNSVAKQVKLLLCHRKIKLANMMIEIRVWDGGLRLGLGLWDEDW